MDIYKLKEIHKPYNKEFEGKKNESIFRNRKRTRPWDNCWFSNKPEIIKLTVEEAIKRHPNYMLWCYANLSVDWSVYTIKMFDAIKPKDFKFNFK